MTTMSFAAAWQTDTAVSFASDISWTYSLDLADSLKPAGPPFFHGEILRIPFPPLLDKKNNNKGGEEEGVEEVMA